MRRIIVWLMMLVFALTLAACAVPASDAGKTSTASKPQEASVTYEPEESVSFADSLLEKMVRDAIGKSEGDITLAEAEAVSELALGIDWQSNPAPNSQITDISGLEHFINLKDLNLDFHAITDITPLAGLTKLTSLSLAGNPVTDISPLAGVTELTFLTLKNCQAQDYSPLAKLTKLGGLLLDRSTITDVSILSGLSKLSWLSLADTQVSDVSPLAGLTNLTQLQLANCPIKDLTVLKPIYPNLEVKDFTVVESLQELGFVSTDEEPQVANYLDKQGEGFSVAINHAEWGEMDNPEDIDMIALCKSLGTEKEIIINYYPEEQQFLILNNQVGVRYTYDLNSEEIVIANGEELLEEFIKNVYSEVDSTVWLTPINDFERVMRETFGMTADMLFSLPREVA